MPDELKFDPNTGLISIRAWGHEVIADWLASRREVVRLNALHNASMLFVDARELESAPSILDILDFGDDWPRKVRTAILIGKETPEDVLFLDSVAVHRDVPIKIFYEEDEAIRWLREPV